MPTVNLPQDPQFNEIDANNLESVRRDVVWNQLFVDTRSKLSCAEQVCGKTSLAALA